MDPRWSLVKDVFSRALELPADKRDAWLRSVCENDQIYDEVADLLASHEAAVATGHLEASPAGSLGIGRRDPLINRRIGPWQIDSLLGEGGMGNVYRGHRADGSYERTVAIKVLRSGNDDGRRLERLRDRLRTEGRILARLEHPNIARFYDLGVSPDGLPYLAMALIDGEPITNYVARTGADLRRRLVLFLEACAAVTNAHQNLIIHQDLKPSNILVDRSGSVKLLDFGIATLLDEDPPDGGSRDDSYGSHDDGEAPRIAGLTPGYASPEQIRNEPVTTATDIYALGVVLYELLAGARPYEVSGLAREEVAEIVCNQRHAPPSVTLAARLDNDHSVEPKDARAERGHPVAPKSVRDGMRHPVSAKEVRADLDAVVMKALNADVDERYASVTDLARDIHSFLAGRPVGAVPSTRRYRTQVFVRRHRRALAGLAILLVAIIAGFIGTISQARIAAHQRDSAERKFGYAREVAGELVFDVHDALVEITGATRVREMVVRRSLAYLDKLAAEPESDEPLRLDIAKAYLRIGNVMGSPINANLGLVSDAMESYRKGLDVLARDMTTDSLATEAAFTRADILEARGSVHASLGQPDSAVQDLRQTIATYEERLDVASADAASLYRLASAYVKLGDYVGNPNFPNTERRVEAMESYETALELLERARRLGDNSDATLREKGVVLERMGVVFAVQEDIDAAADAYRRSFEIRRILFDRNPRRQNIYRDLGVGHEKLGLMFQNAGELDSARVRLEASEAVYRTLAEGDPENVQAQQTLAIGLLHLGDLMWANDRPNYNKRPAANRYFREALQLLQRAAEKDSSDVRTSGLVELMEARLQR